MLTLADCGPTAWTMMNVTISDPKVPFYIPQMDTSMKLLKGKEALCKVQLTKLRDGDVLAITVTHTVTDGMHWPALMKHIAARYRSVVTGSPCNPEELIAANGDKSALSLSRLKENLQMQDWEPRPFPISAGFMDHWRAACLLFQNARKRVNFNIVYVSKEELQRLKLSAQNKIGVDGLRISTGDVVQALAAMMVHGAENKPILPVKPESMLTLIQIPGVEKGYFGNAVHPMAISFSKEEAWAVHEQGQSLDVLTALSKRIRECTMLLKKDPANALQALYETEEICDKNILKTLAFLAGKRLPYVTCTTNYIGSLPSDKELDFGFGEGQQLAQWLVTPLAKDMCIVRPSAAPYGEGLFFNLALDKKQSRLLRQLEIFKDLVPKAEFL
eukprot:jgi/Picsp_1/1945/NSC_05411-R1_hypothetical protein CHLNCDRAFT_54474 [Chlorella variabilis]